MRSKLYITLSPRISPEFKIKALLLLFSGLVFGFTLFSNFYTTSPDNIARNFNAVTPASTAAEIPAVQVFAPGFSVKEIPLTLPNINVVRYGPDGILYALAYDGHIYKLIDTNNDGLEDKAELWWEKDPLIAPVAMVIAPEGIYVTSLNKVSLLKDVNKDGKAETEEIITKDWTKPARYTGNSAGGVDAMGIARDKAGNIFFALGTANFINGYLIDSLGKSHYDFKGERGTIIKIAPGNNKREIYATGTRFPVSMAFNKASDLFASEQEGATWLPNGNPYDELLHIQPDRHYGFPPRHPKHLPHVIDEPSVYDYKPQHQSTCGLIFNSSVNGGPEFGPGFWAEDALVSSYSRGKLYRTKIVKTAAGYVAQNDIIASVSALTVDTGVSPKGDLVIATHSGFPDWGFGPQAKGKLYKVFYSAPQVPNPVAIWSPKPDQVHIAFDKPIEKQYLANLAQNIKIEFGQYVEAGDRFEVLRPGYKAAERQRGFLRQNLKVKTVELAENGQSLILNTLTQTAPVTYAITLPAFSQDKKAAGSIAQLPVMDVAYKLNGVQVNWQDKSGKQNWQGWLPHPDLAISEEFLKGSAEGKDLEANLRKPGTVTLQTKLNLVNMLRPDTQPESTLDYNLPAEEVNVIFHSSEPLTIKAPSAEILPSEKKKGFYETKLIYKEVSKKAYPLEISLPTSKQMPVLALYYSTKEDARLRTFQTHRFFVPWLENIYPVEVAQVLEKPELIGGNWTRGKQLFFGEAICANCHSFNGKGKTIGPDLSNLIYRDYTSVHRDISAPSAAINPDYVAQTVSLNDGRSLVGMVSYKKDSLIVQDIANNKIVVALKDVKDTKPMSASLMPAGLDKMLGEQKMKDLMTYLLTSLKPATYKRDFGVAQVRNGSEYEAVLRKSTPEKIDKSAIKPLKILWVAGPKDHGPDEHDYGLQQKRWTQLLALAEQIKIDEANKWPSQAQFDAADVIVFNWSFPNITEEHGQLLDAFLKRGGGLVYLHFGINATANPEILANRIGLAWKGKHSKFRHGRLTLGIKDNKHPITQGFSNTEFLDESYWNLIPGNRPINILATASEAGADRPMVWTTTAGKGRVFVSLLGHYNWTFDDPMFRLLVLRGIAWSGSQPVNRLEDITLMGARVNL